MSLTGRRQIFVQEYLKHWNGSEAARIAGYAYPGREAYRLLRNAEIQAIIQERVREKAMEADEVLGHLADIARFDAGLLLGKAGVIDWDEAKEQGYTRFIKKMQWTSDGVKVEMYDRADALEKLGKHLRLWEDEEKDLDVTLHVVHDA